jgi:hypothetical protein
MNELTKKIVTWLFSFFNVSIWYDKPQSLETLLGKLEKFKLMEESYQLQLVYMELCMNEVAQTAIMFVTLLLLFLAHADRIWTVIDKIRIWVRSLKNEKK